MPKYHIASIDSQVNDVHTDASVALKKVASYIKKHIDPKFPSADFLAWCNSDAEKPFRANGNMYYWT